MTTYYPQTPEDEQWAKIHEDEQNAKQAAVGGAAVPPSKSLREQIHELGEAWRTGGAAAVPPPLAEISTTLVESEYRQALKWRERFLDDAVEDGDITPLPHQLVCYLIADAMKLRELADLEVVRAPEDQ